MLLSALVGGWLVVASQAALVEPVVAAPYKTEKSWTFFRNDDNGNCTAGAPQPSGSDVLLMAYDAKQKAVSISFTGRRPAGLKHGDERTIDIRLHRPGGVLDDGWEGVRFAVFNGPDRHVFYISELLELVALRDFGEMEAVTFIDHGKTAGSFRMRNPGFAVKEMVRCAEEVRAAT